MNLGDMNPGPMNSENLNTGRMGNADCQPLQCNKAMNCIDGIRNPVATPFEMSGLRGQLAECAPCLQAFDMEVKLKTTVSPSISELPSADFRMRITETLAAVDLSNLDITDF
jgi:hypothetical protein